MAPTHTADFPQTCYGGCSADCTKQVLSASANECTSCPRQFATFIIPAAFPTLLIPTVSISREKEKKMAGMPLSTFNKGQNQFKKVENE
jgi:hypothetical protein